MANIGQPFPSRGNTERSASGGILLKRCGNGQSETIHYAVLRGGDIIAAKQYRAIPLGEQHAKMQGYDLYYLPDFQALQGPVSRWGEVMMSDTNPASRPGNILRSAEEAIAAGRFPATVKGASRPTPVIPKPYHGNNIPEVDYANFGEPEPRSRVAVEQEPLVPVDRNGLSLVERLRQPVGSNWREVLIENERLAREGRGIPSISPSDSISSIETVGPVIPEGNTGSIGQRRVASVRSVGSAGSALPPYAASVQSGEVLVDVGPDIDVAQTFATPVNRGSETRPPEATPRGPVTVSTSSVGSARSSRTSTVSVSRTTIENIVSRMGPGGLSARERASLMRSLRASGSNPIGPTLEHVHEDAPQPDRDRISNYRSVDGSTSVIY